MKGRIRNLDVDDVECVSYDSSCGDSDKSDSDSDGSDDDNEETIQCVKRYEFR